MAFDVTGHFALPEDSDRAILVGRVWRPEKEGPSVVALRGVELVDISATAPTMRDLCEAAEPAALAQDARGEPVGLLAEILANTPEIPKNCQWGIFLRNHDELTLEMVTDEERDYMYSEYAKDPRMKANVGIRRRLAPLLENDRNQIELFTALLLSLPGSPVLYYGDEIGMGDNIWLGDRDGVRTPMQWTPDRNAGFSTANPGRLYLPANQDPVYGYQAVNVEAQRDSSTSLLNWTRTMLAVRRRHDAFAVGTFRELGGSNPSVLAYLRENGDDVVLCVNNLSRFPQPIELNLQHWNGYTPVELTGHVNFPRVGQLPYLLTLPGHGFYWFQLCGSEEKQ